MKKLLFAFLFIIFAFLISSKMLIAQIGFWERTGREVNINTWSIAVANNGDVWAGTNNGIYLSTDNGNSWVERNDGLLTGTSIPQVRAIAISPTNGYIFAGTNGTNAEGLFRSTNNGSSWTNITNISILYSLKISSIVITSSGEIYFGTELRFPNDTNAGVYYSNSNGNNWVKRNYGLGTPRVKALALGLDGTLYAGTPGNGVYRSTDGGDNWSLSSYSNSDDIEALTISGDGSIFATTLSRPGGVLKSTDGGKNWDRVINGLDDPQGTAILYNPITQHIFNATFNQGVFRTTDLGDSWDKINNGLPVDGNTVRGFAVDSTGMMFAGTAGSGVYRLKIYNTPVLYTDIDTIEFTATYGSLPAPKNFSVKNIGIGILKWFAERDSSWFDITPLYGTSDTNEVLVEVSISTTILDTGVHYGSICITAEDAGENSSPKDVVVKYTITDPPPVPRIKIDSLELNFGNITTNNDPKTKCITIQNSGTANLVISQVNITGPGFTLPMNKDTTVSPQNPINIQPDSGHIIKVQFLPTEDIKYIGTVILTHNADSSPDTVWLSGNGIPPPTPRITFNPDSLDFGGITINSSDIKDITIRNTGTANLVISQVNITGPGFTLPMNKDTTVSPQNPITIQPDSGHIIKVQFLPTEARDYTGTVTLIHNARGDSIVSLTGRGIHIQSARITNTDSNTIINEGDSATISFSISGSNETPLTARIYYKAGGTLQYNYVNAENISDLNYSYTFNKGEITNTGLDYYIQAEVDGYTISLPENYQTNPLNIRVMLQKETAPTSVAKMYSLLSLPFDVGNKPATKFLEEQLGPPTLYTWRSFVYRSDDYVEYGKSGFGIKKGEGFWFISKDSVELSFSDVLTNLTNSDFKITLEPGWNIIGDPFLFNIPTENIVLDNQTYDEPLHEFIEEGEGELRRYIAVDTMVPYKGYFIYNDRTTNLDIYIKPSSSVVTSQNQNLSKTFSDEWKINVVLIEDKRIKDEIEIGVISPASTRFTYYKPPPSPAGGADMYLVSSNKYFAKYYYSTTDENMVWDLRIKELKKSTNYSLNLQKSGNIDDDYELVVIDLGTGDKVTMLSDVINIPSGSTEKRYRVVVGKKQFVKDELYNAEISHYKLHQNYPNPFNPSTTIDYVIAENGHVTLKIYNTLGQEVSVLVDGLKDKGKYTVVWNAGNQPSGMYYYKLITRNYSNVKKMILVK